MPGWLMILLPALAGWLVLSVVVGLIVGWFLRIRALSGHEFVFELVAPPPRPVTRAPSRAA